MPRAATLIVLFLSGVQATIFAPSAASGGDVEQTPMLLVVHRPSELVGGSVSPGGSATEPVKIRSDTMLVGVCRENYGTPSRQGWHVQTMEQPPRDGWISASAVTPFETRGTELAAQALTLRALSSANPPTLSLPELIQRQDNKTIQQAWREVAEAVAENETLAENERLPEPYFARAEIWASVENYASSLQDYLTAIKVARLAKLDLLTYSAYFDKLYDTVDKFQEVPVPAMGAGTDLSADARLHYGHGCASFFDGDLTEALHRFDDAVQLAPDQPVYWYYRALTYRGLGDDQRAQHDALLGAYFERQFSPWQRRALNRSFIRVQGETRTWLKSYRLGSPHHRLLREHVAPARLAEVVR